jgi:predicted nucleotidyltransferase component of viral defense system
MLQRFQTSTHTELERAIREILHEVALVGLWRGKFFEHAAFYGGTALRILYGLDRFSEDLDFTLLDPKQHFEWSSFERNVVQELLSYGFNVTFVEKKKTSETAVKSAFLKTSTRHALLQVGIKDVIGAGINPDAVIRIKVEIDSKPILGFDVESVYLREPLPVSIKALTEPSLFAGKINAALYRAWKGRVKGRDWYDLVWFLRRNVPLNSCYLEKYMRFCGELQTDEFLTEDKVKELLNLRVKTINIPNAMEDVRPFLKDPSQLDLWSVNFFQHWINQLRFS